MASIEKFNDHCWKDVIPAADLEVYKDWRRETFVGPRPFALGVRSGLLYCHFSPIAQHIFNVDLANEDYEDSRDGNSEQNTKETEQCAADDLSQQDKHWRDTNAFGKQERREDLALDERDAVDNGDDAADTAGCLHNPDDDRRDHSNKLAEIRDEAKDAR